MPLVRDLSARARLVLTGPDRVRFLHGMVTNDVEALRPGMGCRAAMLTPKGKMQADLVIYADEDSLFLELDGALREKIAATLERHMMMDDVELRDVSDQTRQLGVYGEDAAAAIARALEISVENLKPWHFVMAGTTRIARATELGVPGFHIFGPVEVSGEILSDEEFEVRRVEAGTPVYGKDMGEDRLPIEAGLDDAISFTKGCYLGQEVIARATNLGHINRKLVGLQLEAPVASGTRLSAPSRAEAGVVTSSVVSPRLGPIALAYVHRTLWDPGTELSAEGKTARVTALPFVKY